jgi:DNA helicase-2/ATP-dependent DNA helicase PcrA
VDNYKKAFAQLNREQREAVTQLEGPVLVVAGPGTGKTQLLSARVAHILKSTDARPQNILALTFTNKAAVNMKERIIDLVGAPGGKVMASTFHSFAAEIMNLYPDYFWSSARLSVAPESVQLDIIESIVAQLPFENPLALKFAGQYTLLNDIQRAINLAKEAGLTPEKLKSLIEVNLAYIDKIEPELAEISSQTLSIKKLDELSRQVEALADQKIDELVYPLLSLSTVIKESLAEAIATDKQGRKCAQTGKWKSRWTQSVEGSRGMFKERERNYWWLKLAEVYELYRQALHGKGFYDYSDMLVEVITQLEQNPEILADTQERFSYVLIDEFQDTNPAQLRLAHLVADHHTTEGAPNLMAVGDDDQSIFRFNGAELNNMLGFKRSYPSARIIVLKDNYRSSQAILDVARKVIEQAESRLVNSDPELRKDLVAKNPPTSKGEIKALAYASRELQHSAIASDIKANYSTDKLIAVLARSHDSLIRMASLLQQIGVPVRYEQASNALDHEIVEQVYLLTELVLAVQKGDKTSSNGLVHKILRWPVWGIEPAELWRLAVTNRSSDDWLNAMAKSEHKKLRDMSGWILWLAAKADNQPLSVTIEQILGLRQSDNFLSPIKDYFSQNSSSTNSYLRGLSAIQLLRSMVHEFAAGQEPTLADFVRFIDINKENGIIVADESPFITGRDAVQLLTIHKAKGLEFDHVYIVDATDDFFSPRTGGRKPPSNLPLQPPLDDFDDYVRLLYVACTRAKSWLTISSYYSDHAGKDVATSVIVQGAFSITKISEDDPAKLIQVLEANLSWPDLSKGLEKEMLKARMENYNLAVTHLLNFLDVTRGGPQYFKERNLLRLPEIKTPQLSYGTAIHAALDAAQKQVNKTKLDLSFAEHTFQETLKQEQLPPVDYERYLSKGRNTLSRLFNEFSYDLPKGSTSEQNLRDISIGSARIGGKLDRIDTTGDRLTIIDYKTGSPLQSFSTKDKNKAIKAYKHKLQLIFYAMMASEHSGTKLGSIDCQMVYVDAESAKELVRSYTPTTQDVDHLQKLINAVWQKIIQLDLPDTASYSKDIDGILAFESDLLK